MSIILLSEVFQSRGVLPRNCRKLYVHIFQYLNSDYEYFSNFYRSQRSCGQGYVFTRVCDSVHRGVSRQGEPPRAGRTPLGRENPPGADTPPGADPPGQGEHPQVGRTPPGADTLPLGSRLQHTVNERPVRILLECILVDFLSHLFGKCEGRKTLETERY